MQTKAHFLLLLLAVAAVFQSCERVVEIDDDPSTAQLVLNAVPVPGNTAFVYFARTRFFLDPSNDQPVACDEMHFRANGTELQLDSTYRCRYYFNHTISEGDSLDIAVRSGERMVRASTWVPYVPTISDVSLEDQTGLGTFRFYRAQFSFQDHPGIREYYNLNVTVRDSGEKFNPWKDKIDTIDTVHSTYFMLPFSPSITSSEVSYSIPLLDRLYTRNLFFDSLIDGQHCPVDLYILNLRDTNEREGFKHEYTVTVESLTRDRLRYIIDASRQSSTSSFFAEQGAVRGNVEGAVGLFAGAARSTFTFCPDTLPAAGQSAPTPPEPVLRALSPKMPSER